MTGDWWNETIHSLASSRNYTGNDAIDNVGNYIKEWWRVRRKVNNSDCHELERVFQGVIKEYEEDK